MIRLDLGRPGAVQLRFATSPLWECLIAVRTLGSAHRHRPQGRWAERAERALRGGGLDLLPALVHPDAGYIPDFLAPPPAGHHLGFEAEIARLRLTPAAVVRADLARAAAAPNGGRAASLLALHAGREGSIVERLAGELERCWSRAVAPEWPELETILEREILRRGRELAVGGAVAVLATLHRRVTWNGTQLDVDLPNRSGGTQVGEDGLLLVPSVLGWPDVFTVTDGPWRPTLYFPAGDVTSWLGLDDRAPRDPLVTLTGPSRARVIRALTGPATTLELAQRLDVAPSAISRHLTGLAAAGLVERFRVGRRVFYSPRPALTAMLRLVDEPTANSE